MNTYYKGLELLKIPQEKFPLGNNEYEFDPEETFILDLAEPSNKKKEIKLSLLLRQLTRKNLKQFIMRIKISFLEIKKLSHV